MKTYKASHSELTTAKPEDVWAVWSKVDEWPQWDEGISAAKPNGKFEVGHTFMLTPKGAPNALEVKFVDVVPNERFVDETVLPFGKIRSSHFVKKEGDKTRVTHVIEAEVAPEQADFFEKAIWAGMEDGVAQSVRNITQHAEGKKT